MVKSLITSYFDTDLDLIRKYATSGPRYTSYPPANRFHDRLLEVDVPAAMAADNTDPDRPLSLYCHLPFCESLCWYCGCATIITRNKEWARKYLRLLEREITWVARQINPGRRVNQLHFGGGTPTFFPPESLRRLGEVLRREFKFAEDAEISIEIDPRTLTAEHVGALVDMGVNRASLGVQDTNPVVQEAIHRVQPHTLNEQAVAWLRVGGIHAISLDLIYGLPRQTVASVQQTVDDVLALSPQRLSVFSYAHVPWVRPAQRIFDQRGELPDLEAKLAMFQAITAKLTAAGYIDIGLDHFARPDDELCVALQRGDLHRNFQGYSTRAGASLHGFGISSISQTTDVYFQNHKSLDAYETDLNAGRWPLARGYRLRDEEKRRRRLIMGIMCHRELNFGELSAEFGFDVRLAYRTELKSLAAMERDGVVAIDGQRLVVLPRGIPMLRVVAMAFDRSPAVTGPVHASTI
ncbi:oxygen-independent coproporphyrinogen III oxidase [Synoicihabitans lomoniglobus]|uniref:Coproporphyrinogen-III oxidase n=1 Tax=Synoicihabitans lomoniglobus TaxID=2909285 RepID=A0AAF0CNG2_9BACT|nr:oxygen-independent coproporphyrinogen III oxidase [Opitutaceae bacterium LMO-M01]WED65478.1 oxygen-independent coproporphyrinogen III oxidase [Opitutaceae bacterium LMO-M01]